MLLKKQTSASRKYYIVINCHKLCCKQNREISALVSP